MSEQRRALLLPQEVKELGSEEAIVFCEGLRPIRCQKIRYFADRAFRRRLLPPPPVPLPEGRGVLAPVAAQTSGVPEATPCETAAPASPRAIELRSLRAGTVEDIANLESLTLEDFATDFSKLPVPETPGPLTEGELKTAVDAFLESVKRDGGDARGR